MKASLLSGGCLLIYSVCLAIKMYHVCNCRETFHCFSRVKMFWFPSRISLQLAKCSGPLQRLLSEAHTNLPMLTLFTKKPCPLCDEAKAMLEPYKHKFILQEIDITLPDNSVWFEKYKYDIPVFHLNGQFLMKHRMDTEKLEDQLLKLEMEDDGR